MAMRSPESEERRPIRDLLRRLIKAPAALSILWPVLLIIGGYAAWHRWGSIHVASQYSGIDPTLIQVSEPPPFVRTNVVKAVYRDTAMESLSMLDRQATAKIASAFSMHPWVRNVISVRKLPGGVIDVRLEYRTPVAMVHVFKPNAGRHAQLLFSGRRRGNSVADHRIRSGRNAKFHLHRSPGCLHDQCDRNTLRRSSSRSGRPLAEVLSPYREQAQLRSIGVHGDPRQTEVPQLELTTQTGSRMFWGSPPGTELPGEPTVQMKLRQLLSADSSQNADLRMATPMNGLQR